MQALPLPVTSIRTWSVISEVKMESVVQQHIKGSVYWNQDKMNKNMYIKGSQSANFLTSNGCISDLDFVKVFTGD